MNFFFKKKSSLASLIPWVLLIPLNQKSSAGRNKRKVPSGRSLTLLFRTKESPRIHLWSPSTLQQRAPNSEETVSVWKDLDPPIKCRVLLRSFMFYIKVHVHAATYSMIYLFQYFFKCCFILVINSKTNSLTTSNTSFVSLGKCHPSVRRPAWMETS